jgi:hypothetical protein
VAIELVVLFVLLFGLQVAHGPWWGILGALVLAELIGWTIRFRSIAPLFDFITHTVASLGQAGDRSAVALEKLKGARDRVREDTDGGVIGKPPASAPAEDTPIPLEPARGKFDAVGEPADQPVGDLQEALGGAKTPPTTKTPKPPTKGEEAADAEDATARLLRAKKRAQRNIDEKQG